MYLEMEIESDMGMQLSTLLRIEWICLILVQNILKTQNHLLVNQKRDVGMTKHFSKK